MCGVDGVRRDEAYVGEDAGEGRRWEEEGKWGMTVRIKGCVR